MMRTLSILLILLFSSVTVFSQQDELDEYIERLKLSKKNFGAETAFMSIGSDFLYAQEYFEAKNYSSAASGFMGIINKDSTHAFANYQLAVSLILQNDKYKTQQAQPYLQRAIALKPFLQDRFVQDIPQQATATNTENKKGLDAYIEQLKYSRATGGKETSMFAAGNEVMYGYDYYEKGEYQSAAIRFRQALAVEPQNPYINYLLAISLEAIGKKTEATPFLNKAFAGDNDLRKRYNADIAAAKAKYKKLEDGKKPVTTAPAKEVYGGKLFYGTYVCHQTVYNGANATTAYSYVTKGSFTLKPNGTYRWLDNGETGRYSYDAKTGKIKWLSGFFKHSGASTTLFQPGARVASVSVQFSKDYRWGCGCTK